MPTRMIKKLVEQEVEYTPSFREVVIQFASKASDTPSERSSDAYFYTSMCERDENGVLDEQNVETVKLGGDKGYHELGYHLAGYSVYFILPSRAQLQAMGVTEEAKLAIGDILGGKVLGQLTDTEIQALKELFPEGTPDE